MDDLKRKAQVKIAHTNRFRLKLIHTYTHSSPFSLPPHCRCFRHGSPTTNLFYRHENSRAPTLPHTVLRGSYFDSYEWMHFSTCFGTHVCALGSSPSKFHIFLALSWSQFTHYVLLFTTCSEKTTIAVFTSPPASSVTASPCG